MIGPIELGSKFFEGLVSADEAIVRRAATEPCPRCGGRLYRSDYPRKPRGGNWDAWERTQGAFAHRFSLCCGREGCRRRATPPSVRFLGRRVYLGAIVVAASIVAVMVACAAAVTRATGVPSRTTRRWLRWWRGPFTASDVFVDLSARVVPAPDRWLVPASLLSLSGDNAPGGIRRLLAWLTPLTTTSDPTAARFLRDAM